MISYETDDQMHYILGHQPLNQSLHALQHFTQQYMLTMSNEHCFDIISMLSTADVEMLAEYMYVLAVAKHKIH